MEIRIDDTDVLRVVYGKQRFEIEPIVNSNGDIELEVNDVSREESKENGI